MRRFLQRFLNVFRADRSEAEAAREIAAHLALLEDDYQRRGMTADEARLAARRALGSTAYAQDVHRDARTFAWIDDSRDTWPTWRSADTSRRSWNGSGSSAISSPPLETSLFWMSRRTKM